MGERVYLAARYSRHPEMREKADDLRAMGYVVEVAWILGDHEMLEGEVNYGGKAEGFAGDDVRDLVAADIVISFTEHPGAKSRGRGGRHVEFGMAAALGKRLVVVGPRENVFHWLPGVEQFDEWSWCCEALRPAQAMRIGRSR